MDAGVAIAPRMCVRWEIEQGLLVEVKVRELRMPRDLYVIYRRSGPLSHAATAMLRLLRATPKSPKQPPADANPPATHTSTDI
jgi:DNA-binding transcriptional LysR family regulator